MTKSSLYSELNKPNGEIYIGKIISNNKAKEEKDLSDYMIANDNIIHAIFSAGSRSGKTDAAIRFVSEIANNIVRKPSNKRMRVIALDLKDDWRKLARCVEHERFKFYSMGDAELSPLRINPLKVPYGVNAESHINTLVKIYCNSNELGEDSRMILKQTIKELATDAGVFNTIDPREVSERSSTITLADVFHKLKCDKDAQKFGRDKSKAVDKVLDRLEAYAWEKGLMYKLYSQKDGMSIDELLGKDDVVVLEGRKMYSYDVSFIFGFITASIYMYAKCCEDNFFGANQYETLLVVEEANRIFLGNEDSNVEIQGESIFEEMFEQAAGVGLFVTSITQRPTLLPLSALANSGLMWVGRMSISEDISAMSAMLGNEEKMKKSLPFSPVGQFICKKSRTFNYSDLLPTIVKVDPLNVSTPSNDELREIMYSKKEKK